VLTFDTDYSTLYYRRLRSCVSPIRPRSHPGTGWLQRIHLHEFLANQRGLCPQFAEQARYDGLTSHYLGRRGTQRPFHLRARKMAMTHITSTSPSSSSKDIMSTEGRQDGVGNLSGGVRVGTYGSNDWIS
jgi:hypothetical protein